MSNTVYLLIGQRASGKTNYARRILEQQPTLQMISRDAILEEHFGGTEQSSYSGAHSAAYDMMFKQLQEKLERDSTILILDCWAGTSMERQAIIHKLKEYGADRVVAIYFKTSLELVSTWFWLKPKIAKTTEMREKSNQGFVFYSPDAPARDHGLFHEFAESIVDDGFDDVITIEDPRDDVVTLS